MQQVRLKVATIALLLSVSGSAQNARDFSGVWQMDPSRSESAHQAVPIGPVTLIVEQNASSLTIETRWSQKGKPISSETLKFKLDGSESSISGNSGTQVQTKAHWEGTKLITETSRNIQGSTVTTMHVFSLDASGKELTIDKTFTVQHGYQFQGANNTGRGKDVFIKRRDRAR
jgi:hypothetical protein